MKKINAILSECKIVDRLLSIKEKRILSAIETAKYIAEEEIAKAQTKYEQLLKKLPEESANYLEIINGMIDAKQVEINGAATLTALNEILEDLNSEVKVVKDSK